MKIIVCVKQIPDTRSVRLDPVTHTLIRTGVPSMMNPNDKNAVETALAIKAALPGVTVTALTMGLPMADTVLREAMAMGCDDAALLTDRRLGGADSLATAAALAGAARVLGFDLVLCGQQAADGETAQVPQQMGEFLSVPAVTFVSGIEGCTADTLTVKRQLEEGYQKIAVPLPGLAAVLPEANAPRYMTVGGIADAYAKDITTLTYDDIAAYVPADRIGLAGSATSVLDIGEKEKKGQCRLLRDLSPDEAAQAILDLMVQKHIL